MSTQESADAADDQPAAAEQPAAPDRSDAQPATDEQAEDQPPVEDAPAEDEPATDEQAEDQPPVEDAPAEDEPATDDGPATDDQAEDRTPAEDTPAPVRARRWRTAHHRAAALIGVLTLVLGFAIAVQVHANSQSDSLTFLRDDDLISILNDQDARADRLRQQISDLQSKLDQLRSSGDQSAAAKQQAAEEATELGILLGTIAATGPGVAVTITDPSGQLGAEDLLDVIEELRGAGAEAIEFGGVRVGPNSAFTTVDDHPALDGNRLSRPYQVLAIGDPATLATALSIPGGVADTIRTEGGNVSIAQRKSLDILAVRALPPSNELRPSGH